MGWCTHVTWQFLHYYLIEQSYSSRTAYCGQWWAKFRQSDLPIMIRWSCVYRWYSSWFLILFQTEEFRISKSIQPSRVDLIMWIKPSVPVSLFHHACGNHLQQCIYVCVCGLGNSKPSTQIWDSQAKQWLWEECEGVCKQSHLQKKRMCSVYWEHGDEVDHFTSAPATSQQLKFVYIQQWKYRG
jgi:hypothetical protein